MTLHTVSTGAFLRALSPDSGHKGRRQPDKLLGHLMLNPGRFCSYNELFDTLWGERADGGPDWPSRTIWQYVYHMRRAGIRIETASGVGLRLA